MPEIEEENNKEEAGEGAEDMDTEQEEYEMVLHSVVWPELDDEPEPDPDILEEIDALVWEIAKDD